MQQNVNMFKVSKVHNNIHIMNNGQEKSAYAHKVDQKKGKKEKKEKENSSPLGSIILAWVVHHVISLSLCVLFFLCKFFSSKRISKLSMKGKGYRQKETLSMYLVIASRSTHKPVLVSTVVKILDASEQANLNSTEVLNNNIYTCFPSLNKITNIR
jgi:hypothetical protein